MSDGDSSLSIWVVMPTYNGAAHLREQLESISNQRRRPDGLVASDDGSSDETFRILEDFAGSAPFPVQLMRHEINLGLLGNLESALAQAITRADVVAFADQDAMIEAYGGREVAMNMGAPAATPPPETDAPRQPDPATQS